MRSVSWCHMTGVELLHGTIKLHTSSALISSLISTYNLYSYTEMQNMHVIVGACLSSTHSRNACFQESIINRAY